MNSSLFLSIDGVDGAGKTTQCRLLAEWLECHGVPLVSCRDPGGTALGSELRRLLLHSTDLQMTLTAEALLFMASRAQLVAEVIRPALARSDCVLCDRYILANVVYQGHAGGLDPEELWRIGRWAADGVEPDLTLILDLEDPSVALQRKGPASDRMERRDLEYYRRVRDGYRCEAQRCPQRLILVPAEADVDVVQQRLRQLLLPVLRARGWNLR